MQHHHHHQQGHFHQLNVLFASYGPQDVTDTVRQRVQNNELHIQAENNVFGDPWPGVQKSFVIIYQYGHCRPSAFAVKEHETIHITPNDANLAPWTGYNPGNFTVVAAVYGLHDVTQTLVNVVQQNGLNFKIDNATFQDGWPGVAKTFIAAFIDPRGQFQAFIKKENDAIQVADNSKLTIVKAAYGLAEVTGKVQELVNKEGGHSLNIQVSNNVFGDTWPGTAKALVVVYQEGSGPVQIAIQKESGALSIGQTPQHLSPQKLYILKAAWGKGDVTAKVQEFANQQGGGSLKVPASNNVFGDTWPGVAKSLVIVYQYGGALPQVAIQKEGAELEITYQPTAGFYIPPRYDGELQILGAAYGLTNATDRIKQSIAGNTLNIEANNNVLGDGWAGTQKTLVVVWRRGQSEVFLSIVNEGQHLKA